MSEIDSADEAIGELHGPFPTEDAALEAAQELEESEAMKRVAEALDGSNPSPEQTVRFGIFSED